MTSPASEPTAEPGAPAAIEPVRQSITVRADVERTFHVFVEEFDSWWPRSHHIGKSPLKTAIIEGRLGGRCYNVQMDGPECDWGTVLEWEPPHRFVFAWQITPQWTYEPDHSKASEVEVRFTPVAGGSTRVDLEHRHFERHGAGGMDMRKGVSAPDGWGGLLRIFAAQIEPSAAGA